MQCWGFRRLREPTAQKVTTHLKYMNTCRAYALHQTKLHICIGIVAAIIPNQACESQVIGPPKKLEMYGIFCNDGPITVRVEISNWRGNEKTEMILAAHEITKTVIVKGMAKVYTPTDRLSSGKLLSTMTVPEGTSALQFFETSTRTFYFRIRNGRIGLVRPNEAMRRQWEALERR
jgi:hypothetical protein